MGLVVKMFVTSPPVSGAAAPPPCPPSCGPQPIRAAAPLQRWRVRAGPLACGRASVSACHLVCECAYLLRALRALMRARARLRARVRASLECGAAERGRGRRESVRNNDSNVFPRAFRQ